MEQKLVQQFQEQMQRGKIDSVVLQWKQYFFIVKRTLHKSPQQQQKTPSRSFMRRTKARHVLTRIHGKHESIVTVFCLALWLHVQ